MNSSSSWFTSYERSLLKTDYGTQRQRLTRDHSKPLDYCGLCLQRARDPVCCASHGDVFCRECAVANLLSQRQEIKRLQKEIERRHADEQAERARLESEAVQRGIKEFENLQMGLEQQQRKLKRKADDDDDKDNNRNDSNPDSVPPSTSISTAGETSPKRARTTTSSSSFTLDESELLRIARSDRTRLKSSIEAEKSAAAAPKLPSFWIPSLTPSLSTPSVSSKPPKLQPVCPGSDPSHLHNYSLKALVTVHFAEDDKDSDRHGDRARICPNCKKVLSNETKAVVAKPCGHVLCKPCVKKFILAPVHDDPHAALAGAPAPTRCTVCDTDLSDPAPPSTTDGKKASKKKDRDKDKDAIKPGLVQISSDGTGFPPVAASQSKNHTFYIYIYM
ncbi:hypothetical protein DRE_03734 [Drechslerella stenobrocha 248]|uniref:RING-type domain-containing protein n=1 Tax=Drechslerella stenobrocha 248 TaxID=1043628 RepID=W7I3M1_9PEZI|nr:hypothetical protein DRE_03734 [Drechslerella stenobrocha 248]